MTLLKQRPPAGTPIPPPTKPRTPQTASPRSVHQPTARQSRRLKGWGVLDFHSTRRAVVDEGEERSALTRKPTAP